VPEWLNGTVSKTVVGHRSTEGSNPSLPAKLIGIRSLNDQKKPKNRAAGVPRSPVFGDPFNFRAVLIVMGITAKVGDSFWKDESPRQKNVPVPHRKIN
jgi:hypothetical protein